MRITEEMADEIAALARLALPQGEKAAMAAELERILAYMEVLGELDTGGVEPMSHVFPLKNVVRPDEIAPSLDRAELLRGAPAADGASFLVPRTVE